MTDYHTTLLRQLKKTGLSIDEAPGDVTVWQEFLNKVNNFYHDSDQERYLLSRSMDLSSEEMFELNDRLQAAQRIAKMGAFVFSQSDKRLYWSQEAREVLGNTYCDQVHDIEDLIKSIRNRDELHLETLFQSNDGKINMEAQIQTQPDMTLWVRFMAENIDKNSRDITGALIDISASKKYEARIRALNQQLLNTAKEAGKAEIASSILHNVGNILNSIIVSSDFFSEILNSSHVSGLDRITKLLATHQKDISDYLTRDEKGKLIPAYLIELNPIIQKEIHTMKTQIKELRDNIQHIKNIVASQEPISRSQQLREKLYLSEVIDESIAICRLGDERKDITVKKDYSKRPFLNTDRTALLEILVNLIKNAKESLNECKDQLKKEICISIHPNGQDNNFIEIEVIDNGMGITQENLGKIFRSGFTTKETGHGIGLHASAIIARNLGGELKAESEGAARGATFILTLPLPKVDEQEIGHEK